MTAAMKLAFANYHKPFSITASTWSDTDNAQAEAICNAESWHDNLADYRTDPDSTRKSLEEWEILCAEVVDVVDESGQARYQIWFFDFGTAYMYEAGTVNEVGGASQHGFELNDDDDELYDAIASAYKDASPKIRQMMSF